MTETNVSQDAGVSRLIEDAVALHGGRVAVVERRAAADRRERSVTYEELGLRVRGFAAALTGRGVRPGDRVAVLLDNSVETVVTEWACLRYGFVWVALNARTSREEAASILSDCRPSVLVVSPRLEPLVPEGALPAGCRRVRVGEDDDAWFANGLPAPRALRAPGKDDPVRIRYTSGTAGNPKGAVLTRGAYDASVEAVARVLAPVDVSDTLLHVAPMTHASGAMGLPRARSRSTASTSTRSWMSSNANR